MIRNAHLVRQASFRINRLRRRLACRFTDFGPPPPRALVILCNPRSGSTLLFDALRGHPAVTMHPRYTLFAALGCLGRRYPVDLSAPVGDGHAIELEPQRFAHVPAFACAPGLAPEACLSAPVALEKPHPHFFDFDQDRFVAGLGRLQRTTDVRLLHLVREPEGSLRSFLRYRARNPRWHAQVSMTGVAVHLARTYETIRGIALRCGGPILDYDELVVDLSGTLRRVFEQLWPDVAEPAPPTLLAEIERRTARAARPEASVRRFLGDDVSPGDEPLSVLPQRDLTRCRSAYADVLALRT